MSCRFETEGIHRMQCGCESCRAALERGTGKKFEELLEIKNFASKPIDWRIAELARRRANTTKEG